MLKNLTRGVPNKGWNFWEFLRTDFLRLNYTGQYLRIYRNYKVYCLITDFYNKPDGIIINTGNVNIVRPQLFISRLQFCVFIKCMTTIVVFHGQ